MQFSIRLIAKNQAALLTMSGRVIAEGNQLLREHLEALKESDAPVKAVDLTDVEFIDSYALGQIIFYCKKAGGDHPVLIVNKKKDGKSYIERLIECAQLNQVFSIVDDIDVIGPSIETPGA